MTIVQIKEQLQVLGLNFQEVLDNTTGLGTGWHQAFDKVARIMVVAPEEILASIAADPTISDVSLKDDGIHTPKNGGAEYHKYFLVRYKEVSYAI